MDVESYLLGKKAGGGTPVSLQDKEVEITENGETEITADEGYTGLGKVDLTTNVQPDLESKSITISTNTTTTITPTSGKDGLSSVEITTNVPQPSGKITITQNGTDIDVSSYASADVNVPVGGKYAPKWVRFGGSNANYAYQGTDLVYETSNLDTSNMTSLKNMFISCSNLSLVDVTGWNTSNIIDMNSAFRGCNFTTIDFTGWNTSNVTNMNSMFSNNFSLSSLNLSSFNTSEVTDMSFMFSNCSSLTSLNLSNFTKTKVTTMDYTFSGCSSLMFLDVRNMEFSKGNYTKGNMLNSVPTSCEIIVKDATQKAWFNTNFSSYTNVKTVAEISE